MIRVRWKRLDQPGSEDFLLRETDKGWFLKGTVRLEKTSIHYTLSTDSFWRTQQVQINDTIITVDSDQRWFSNNQELEQVRGCIDADLSFTPSTNTLPIRRLALAVGESALVRSAWYRFPEMDWRILEQTYRRESATEYHYESDTGFKGRIVVDEGGLVREYSDVWIAE